MTSQEYHRGSAEIEEEAKKDKKTGWTAWSLKLSSVLTPSCLPLSPRASAVILLPYPLNEGAD